MAKAAGVGCRPVSERHWIASSSGLVRDDAVESELGRWGKNISLKGSDASIDKLLQTRKSTADPWLFQQYVEGFFAADSSKISAQFVAKTLNEESGNFCVSGGYLQLLEWICDEVFRNGAKVYLNTVVEKVQWRRGDVRLMTQTPEGQRSYHAPWVIITLPLGVLKGEPGTLGSVHFTPALVPKKSALQTLEMGRVVKVQLRFSESFWRKEMGCADFGFLHTRDTALQTWWSEPSGTILTGWSGGGFSDKLDKMEVIENALRDLEELFHRPVNVLKSLLQDWRFHDWRSDPFSRGAYSYSTAGHQKSPEELGTPIEQTLFFAGEATVPGAAQGTVHGALRSGQRAANQIIELVEKRRRRRLLAK